MEKIWALISENLWPFVVIVVLLGSGNFMGTEGLKKLSRLFKGKLDMLNIRGDGSWWVAVLIGALFIFGFDIDMFQSFASLSSDSATAILDPELSKLIQSLLVGLAGQTIHDKTG
jgi:hypothetical protein